jgi:hypothetical protein
LQHAKDDSIITLLQLNKTRVQKMHNYNIDSKNTINIYPQFTYHDNAEIVGTRKGLIQLREAINSIFDSGNNQQIIEVYTNDGQKYQLFLRCFDENELDQRRPYYRCNDPIVFENKVT